MKTTPWWTCGLHDSSTGWQKLVDPASKRRTHQWGVEDVVAPDGFSLPTLDQYYRALDVVAEYKETIERHVYAAMCDLANLQLTLACYDLTSSYLEGDPSPSSTVSVEGVRLLP